MPKIHCRNARDTELITLFKEVFTASEGAEEGATIGQFVERMLTQTDARDIRVFAGWDGSDLVAAALFSRLTYSDDTRTVMILSPMAVATARQGEGFGQALIRHALAELAQEGTDIALTYGDPNFYGKVGFPACFLGAGGRAFAAQLP